MAKFLTLNTHSWMEEEPEQKLADLVQQIVREDYDVICLQEVNQEINSSPAEEVAGYVVAQPLLAIHDDHFAHVLVGELQKAGLQYYWSWAYNHIGYDRYHEGVAILSKEPLEAKELLVSDIDDPKDYRRRQVLLAETVVDGQAIQVASVHLSWWNKGFQAEWARLEAELKASSLPLVLMGDFNNPAGQEGYEHILASPLQLQDSHLVAKEVQGEFTMGGHIDGWEAKTPPLRIDFTFLSPSWQVERSAVIFDGVAGPIVSDHFGLEVLAYPAH
ncbi:endonuclease/exonuclease/phosphatase family protein [Streptococcus danieliae]|uniref:Endonuclease/exonuclease/phosphatase family protein n=1 Tax=Streptococcus danieliae TaxID=747656 RepID=A0A7Z0M5I5_9STRE|nr:endonuclease/exonuclease/phosphatase family protein [Streptococcus danieliae]MBF0698658.1 endonuclease/exonuclease/phosphatase family protein [Streptococcus danieliae]NYS95835.1 endonuclease/exonuclease/phosphatase family protein [Streptococcus danieliae]